MIGIIFSVMAATVWGQMELLTNTKLGVVILDTIRMQIQSDEPIGNLIDLIIGIEEQINQHYVVSLDNYNAQIRQCEFTLQELINEADELHEDKIDLREELQLVRPRIQQLLIVADVKERERQILQHQTQLVSGRYKEQQRMFDENVEQLDEQRYDYVAYRVPFKADQSELKPLVGSLVDYINQQLHFEDKVLEAKREHYQTQVKQITEMYHNLVEFQEEINTELEDLHRQISILDIEWSELLRQIQMKLDQIDDVKQECISMRSQYQHESQQTQQQLATIQLAIDQITNNFGWLRAQIGV